MVQMLKFTNEETAKIVDKNALRRLERHLKAMETQTDEVDAMKLEIQKQMIQKGDKMEDIKKWRQETDNDIAIYGETMEKIEQKIKILKELERDQERRKEEEVEELKRQRHYDEELKLEEAKQKMRQEMKKKLERTPKRPQAQAKQSKYGEPSEIVHAHVQKRISLQPVHGSEPGRVYEFYLKALNYEEALLPSKRPLM
eukprot:gene6382-11820_t